MDKYLINYQDIKNITGQDEIVAFITEKVREYIEKHA